MDLHTWITQQVDAAEAEGRAMLLDPTPLLRRCEADRQILARHTLNTDDCFGSACRGCDLDSWGLPNTENLNDCPELLDLAHAHGISDEVLAGLDQPQPPAPSQHAKVAHTPSGARLIARLYGEDNMQQALADWREKTDPTYRG